jgi:hypothetical protein
MAGLVPVLLAVVSDEGLCVAQAPVSSSSAAEADKHKLFI